jgi:TIR domain
VFTGARFIRPLVWERRPPPWPPELATLQFGRLELPWFARGGVRWGGVAAMCCASVIWRGHLGESSVQDGDVLLIRRTSTWFDERQIRAGDSLTRQIESGLARAEIVVLFLSRSSLASAWVDAEMRAALHAQIDKRQYRALIPVVLDECEIPALLRDYRRIVASEPALIVEELRAAVNGVSSVRP